ncbi:MAG: hypothetical protein KKB51_23245 [Candidatus Riflebacteria bacterium]|nr:hypothetical protein [Candidatus Riflebacteria bacterium]
MNSKLSKLTLAMCLSACIAFAGEPASTTSSAPATLDTTIAATDDIETNTSFPLVLKEKEIIFNQTVSQKEMETRLTELLGEKTEMDATNRLQYDFETKENMPPTTIVIDYGESGKIEQIILDAMSEEENLPAQELLKWLNEKAGAGKQGTGEKADTTEWQLNTWNFAFTNGDDGEDSVYSFHITPLTEKE